ncbi:Methionyl-tRNA formyltransferase [Onygenales sp. PD_10]|nr:Methionyl-tRNA formyltransferase [Onygenales sp. PD_10]
MVNLRFSILRRPLVVRTAFINIRYASTKSSDPLRILFCGSDSFSIASLKALYKEHVSNPKTIQSIDVVCRPGKKYGRGLKKIREVPIKAAATELSLPIHEIDTFTGWTPPSTAGINLIIAVSFGLFVPPRLLNYAKYGGLNVHPSLLPEFRGPAPLHHTLLAGRTTTGVTLQTLDPKSFDHGVILDQTPSPGFDIPNPETCSVPQLLDLVSNKSAQMLVQGIRNRVFVPPLKDVGWISKDSPFARQYAGKITPEERHVDWKNWPSDEIIRRQRLIGPVWGNAIISSSKSEECVERREIKRLIFKDLEILEEKDYSGPIDLVHVHESNIRPGTVFIAPTKKPETCISDTGNDSDTALYVYTLDRKIIQINEMQVESLKPGRALIAARKANILRKQPGDWSDGVFYGDLQ